MAFKPNVPTIRYVNKIYFRRAIFIILLHSNYFIYATNQQPQKTEIKCPIYLFYSKWNIPICVVDRETCFSFCHKKKKKNSGSLYFNSKRTFSIVLIWQYLTWIISMLIWHIRVRTVTIAEMEIYFGKCWQITDWL